MTKKLIFIFFVLLFVYSFILIYINQDRIVEYIKNKTYEPLVSDTIPNGNEYEKKYEYMTFKERNDSNVYNKNDIISLLYTLLNKGADRFTFYCPDEYETCADDVIEVSNDKKLFGIMNNYLSPFNSYNTFNITITNDKEVLIKIERLYTIEEISNISNEIKVAINKLKLEKETYNLNDVKKVHDYLLDKISYDDEYDIKDGITPSSKATGALLNGKSVCGGYADAFALFMDFMNIPNFKVTSEEHIWNVIYIDSEWKHVDVTWDDDENNPSNNHNFFIISTDELNELDTKEHNFDINDYLELKSN